MTSYRIDIDQDHDTDDPNDYGAYRVVSFSNRDYAYRNPDQYTMKVCEACDGRGFVDTYDQGCETCDDYGEVSVHPADHPDVLATLSHYEHGRRLWMVGPSTVPDYGGFDTVGFAGLIVWNDEGTSPATDGDRAWWDTLDDDRRREVLESVAEEYTAWCNGDTYYFHITETGDCDQCHRPLDGDIIGGYGGIIGTDYLADCIAEELRGHGVDVNDIEMGGELGFVLDTHDIAEAMTNTEVSV